jgi:diaminopimelate epimerase
MSKISFCKMQALGNDFAVLDNIHESFNISELPIAKMADRHFGIGFDQLLLLQNSDRADFSCRFYNADGSEAEQCGNGIRCIARFIQEKKLLNLSHMTIATAAGDIAINIDDFSKIKANMGVPIFEPKKIPFLAKHFQKIYELQIDHPLSPLKITALSMGNPHAILRVDALSQLPLAEFSKKITPYFPMGVNVGLIEIKDRKHISLRTFERGVGETFACGSNACAAVVAGILNDWLDHTVDIELPHGNLTIEWKGENHPVIMIGPAEKVFDGEYFF